MSTTSLGRAGLSATEKRALLAELLRKKAAENASNFPLSYGQKALLYLSRLDPDTPTYNAMFAIRLDAEVSIEALRTALQGIIDRHAALRTTYVLNGERFVQRVHAAREADFAAFDASMWDQGQLEARLIEDASHPYNLERDSVMRLRVYSRSRESHVLMLGVHHIAFDFWSYDVFAHELIELYTSARTGKQSKLSPLKCQFSDYVQWQRDMLASPRGEQLFRYWERELAGEVPALNLPTDRVRPMIQTYHGSSFRFSLEPGIVGHLRTLANQRNVTLYTLLLSAFQILLHRYTGQEDILIGSPMACRDSPQFEHLIAYFSNVVPLRANLAGDPLFTTFLGQVRTKVLGALEHQDYPLPLIVERIAPKRDPSRSPLLDVAFSWEKSHHQAGREALNHDPETQLPLDLLYARQLGAPYDVILLIFEGQASLSGTFLYNSDLFDQERISRMAAHFEALLLGIADHPDGRISELSWFTDQERQQIVAWNSTASAFPSEQCLHQLFEVHASSSPDAVAAWCEGEQLSYAELNRRANQLARYLAKKGVGPDVLVGLCIGRSLDMLIALLGIMKAGGAYVPLDPDYPSERLAHMLADSGVKVLLTEATLVERLPANQADLVRIDTDREQIAQESADDFHSGVRPDNLVYVIYTSGSTGKPKGVLIEHRGLSNLAEAQLRTFALRPDERVLQFASLSYDASIFEIAMAIKTGATLYIATGESRLSGEVLAGLLRQQAITNVTLPPSIVALMPAQDLPALRTMIVAGEPCTPEIVVRWAAGRRLFNAYGPTETTVWATVAECHADMRRPPIGRPILNTRVHLLDGNLQPVPIGVAGELHIGGVGLARGYLNRPELTAEKFIPDPFNEDLSTRLYKTGDLARYLPTGDIEFLDRIDHQVKIRGFRIELGEIEAILHKHTGVREAVIIARENARGEKQLVAYFVSQGVEVGGAELRRWVKEKLPEYMVPSAFVQLERIPINANGKLDKHALPAPEQGRPELNEPFAAPESDLEQAIAEIWKAALGLREVGRYDNFFDLGGHSLLVAETHPKLEKAVGRRVPVVDMFRHPTISALAKHLNQIKHQDRSFEEVRERARQQKWASAQRVEAIQSRRAPK